MRKIIIGIQARSSSTRLPRKAFEMIGGRRLLDHVVAACNSAAWYVNKFAQRDGIQVETMLLVPEGDEIVGKFTDVKILEGPLFDVLSRYYAAVQQEGADFIVRITGDCPLIPHYIIAKHIKIAAINNYDYLSNVDERLSIDGVDCEVISKEMMTWLNDNAKTDYDREHVTTLARSNRQYWAKYGATQGFFDLEGIKLSVDTAEDLAKVRLEYDRIDTKVRAVERKYGRKSVHRF